MNTMYTMRRLLPAAILAVLAGTAAAQQEKEVQGSLDQPLAATAPSSGSSFVFLSQADGDDTYQVELNGDKVTAKINGKKIPSDRVRRSENKVEILDKEGNVLTTFDVQVPRAQVRTFNVTPRSGRSGTWTVPVTPEPPQAWAGFAGAGEPPKTMIGIRMDDAAEGEVALTDVIDDLPAARAGLKPGDVLVSINGKKIEKVTDIRDSIKDKNAGDKVAVIAKRDGAEKTFELTLDAYDTEVLMGPMPNDEMKALEALSAVGKHSGKFADEARRALEQALKEIESSKAMADFEKSWSDAMKQAIKALEQHKGELTTVWGQLAAPAPSARSGRTLVAPEGEMVFVEPRGQRTDVNKRLDELSARLEKLGAQLEKLTEQLEKKNP